MVFIIAFFLNQNTAITNGISDNPPAAMEMIVKFVAAKINPLERLAAAEASPTSRSLKP